jgi:hypothetical protein
MEIELREVAQVEKDERLKTMSQELEQVKQSTQDHTDCYNLIQHMIATGAAKINALGDFELIPNDIGDGFKQVSPIIKKEPF